MKRFVLLLVMGLPVIGIAEPVYIDDKVMAGLHQDKSVDSPVLKVLPSGTTLEMVRRDNPLSQVTDPEGITGWIDNKYLADTAPGRAQLQSALDKIKKLETEIAAFKPSTTSAKPGVDELSKITKENDELKQLLKSERLRIGELQTQTAELRNQLAKTNGGGNTDLMQQLDKLARENAELEKRLGDIQTGAVTSEKQVRFEIGEFDWKKILITVAVSLLAGLVGGMFLLDWMNRRRHGGFRI